MKTYRISGINSTSTTQLVDFFFYVLGFDDLDSRNIGGWDMEQFKMHFHRVI